MIRTYDVGLLMALQPQSVTGPVREVLTVPLLGYVTASDRIDLRSGHARFCLDPGPGLRLQADLEDLPQLPLHRPNRVGARDVTHVAPVLIDEVDPAQFPAL